jgi:tetratricopeptide (TPR) repeat protein
LQEDHETTAYFHLVPALFALAKLKGEDLSRLEGSHVKRAISAMEIAFSECVEMDDGALCELVRNDAERVFDWFVSLHVFSLWQRKTEAFRYLLYVESAAAAMGYAYMPSVHLALGELYRHKGQRAEAIAYLKRVLNFETTISTDRAKKHDYQYTFDRARQHLGELEQNAVTIDEATT